MSELRLVRTTVDDRSRARFLAHNIVENNLAACVSVGSAVTSYYVWQGELKEDTEYPLVVKTHRDRQNELMEWIRANHPYDCPELVVTPVVDADLDYEDWVREQCS